MRTARVQACVNKSIFKTCAFNIRIITNEFKVTYLHIFLQSQGTIIKITHVTKIRPRL